MSKFKHIRIKMGMSQLKLATYLGVSRSLVYFVEKGIRSLPTRALLKFGQLELKFNEISHSPNFSAVVSEIEQMQKREKVKKCIRDKEKLINRILSLKIRHTRLKRAYRKCMGAVASNIAVAYNMQHIKTDRGDDLWVAINISDTYHALKYCNKAKQNALMADIRKAEASVTILDDYIRQNMLKIEGPAIRMIEAA